MEYERIFHQVDWLMTIKRFKNTIFFTLLLMGCASQLAASPNETHEHHAEHQRVGHHGMVLVTDGETLFANHLPLYFAPHDYQLLYKVESDIEQELIEKLVNGETLTILPEKFDLNTLVEGEALSITTRIYDGHFERGGTLRNEDSSFKFVLQVYKRKLHKDMKAHDGKSPVFDIVQTTKGALLVHKIAAKPSFDLLISVNSTKDKFDKCVGKIVKSINQLPMISSTDSPAFKAMVDEKLSHCGKTSALYLETRDFAE